jgi:hypothetical protein
MSEGASDAVMSAKDTFDRLPKKQLSQEGLISDTQRVQFDELKQALTNLKFQKVENALIRPMYFDTATSTVNTPIFNESAQNELRRKLAEAVQEGSLQPFKDFFKNTLRNDKAYTPGALNQNGVLKPDALDSLTELSKKIREIEQKLQQQQNNSRNNPDAPIVPRSNNQRTQDIPLGSSRSVEAMGALAKSLSSPNNNIDALASAVSSLSPVAKNLENSVKQLAGLFSDGKIKIDQQAQANLNVTFENGIPLEIEQGIDRKIADSVENKMSTLLADKFGSFTRQLLGGA